MTKAAALLLAGSLALAACASDEDTGSSGGGESASETIKVGLAYDTGGRGDRSFNDSAYAGVEAALEANPGDVSELSPNSDASSVTSTCTGSMARSATRRHAAATTMRRRMRRKAPEIHPLLLTRFLPGSPERVSPGSSPETAS